MVPGPSPEGDVMKGVQLVVDDEGQKTAVVIDLERSSRRWEDSFDRALAESRKAEPRESLAARRKRLSGKAAHGADG